MGTKTAGVFSGAEYDVQSDMRLSTRVSPTTYGISSTALGSVAATWVQCSLSVT
jgi:ABC-type multidrug transport system permease subunit